MDEKWKKNVNGSSNDLKVEFSLRKNAKTLHGSSVSSNKAPLRNLQRLLGSLRFPYQERFLFKEIQGHHYLSPDDWRVRQRAFNRSLLTVFKFFLKFSESK